jgi:serine/threonine-protein kinase
LRADAKESLVGTLVDGRYRIEALIGEGGMGAVYRAEQIELRKKVAVKVLHRDMVLNTEIVARFEREAVAGGRITHPNVASAFDFGRLDNGMFYLALEFVEGKSLGRVMDETSPLPERRALRIARQIADALAAAHAAGVVHRDLKPENVMLLDRPAGDDLVKVLDFGIAKLRSTGSGDTQPLTQLGTVFGTPEYMSPEQARGMEVDGRSDLYTLGLILYEMLSGASPFRHEDVVVILARQLSMNPPPLSDRVSRPTRDLVLALLKKDIAERPTTAAGVRDRIDALLGSPELDGAESAPEVELDLVTGPAKGKAAEPRPSSSPDAPTLLAMPRANQIGRAMPAGDGRDLAPETLRRRRGGAVALFGHALPRRVLYAFAGLLALGALLVVSLLWVTHDEGPAAADPAAIARDRARVIEQLVTRVEAGDRAGLAVLAEVPAAEHTPRIRRALVRGYCDQPDREPCWVQVERAVRESAELAQDPRTLYELRRFAASEAHGPAALDLAAGLGDRGADLLFDVASDRGLGKSALPQRARDLLREDRVSRHASPALKAAWRLSAALKAPRCGELKELLAELAAAFDQRAMPSLSRLNERRGCGILGLGDCYGCLRAGRELRTAIDGAKSRPAPKFELAPPVPSAR